MREKKKMADWREKVGSLVRMEDIHKIIPTKLRDQLKHPLATNDDDDDVVSLLSELVPHIIRLHTHSSSPIRKFVAEILGDIGMKHVDFTPQIMPVLITMLKDETPAVARQAIRCGIDLFRSTLVKVAIQGLYSSDLESSLESSWAWVQKFREEVYAVAFEPRSDGTKLVALKFVEALLLLYTPDPCGPPEPPPYQASKGVLEFNISWIRRAHRIFNVGDLRIEARQSLGLLLDHLRIPTSSNSIIIVLINSLSTIATKRPSFYGHILPVLLGLDVSSFTNKGIRGFGVHHALKNAFLSCLKFQHPSAVPWRDRLVSALKEMKAEGLAEESVRKISQINGNVELKDDSPITLVEKPSISGGDVAHANSGKKRSGSSDSSDLAADYNLSSKRARSLHVVVKSEQDNSTGQDNKQATPTGDGNNAHVQQLVAMFGTFIAQGEKAIGSLEILISSISADLLAEVVMATMRNLPPNFPQDDWDEEPLLDKCSYPNVGRDAQLKQLLSILTEMLPLPDASLQLDAMQDAQPSALNDIESTEVEEEPPVALVDCNEPSTATEYGDEKGLVLLPCSSDEVLSARADGFSAPPEGSDGFSAPPEGSDGFSAPPEGSDGFSALPEGPDGFSALPEGPDGFSALPEGPDVGFVGSGIPGLESSGHHDGSTKTFEDFSEDQISSFSRGQLELANSMSTERSEELSPKASITDASSIASSATTSMTMPPSIVLPRMSAPVINLVEEEKDQIQNMALGRIVEAYKEIAVAGGSHLHSTLLAYLAVEFPLELDPWKILKEHILSDYVNHEGHELTLCVLYRLFREAEEERDFFSSTTATSVYDTFLLTVAETLRDSFPASDKSLSRLLGEAPYLPNSLFKLLDGLCSPASSDKELNCGDRVTQGLSAVWGLILLRPPTRDACLKIAIQSAVHHLEEVRMKAIRLVANKLYPLPSISQQIEDFAKEMLYSVSIQDKTVGRVDGDRSELQKDTNVDNISMQELSGVGVAKDQSSGTSQFGRSQNASSSLTEALRCMSLYFALCTKKHSLFRELFFVYKSASDTIKQAVHHQIPILVRTIGSSPELLEILSDPPIGIENLLMQVLHALTDGTIPSPELVGTVRKLFDTKIKDLEILFPILSYLPKDEVLLIFPHFVNLPSDKFQAAVTRLLQGSYLPDQLLSPAEILIAIHGIDPDRDGIPLKKVTDACNICFEQRHIFTQQVLAKVLNQLVEQIPLPLLFMRTVLQAIGAFPALVDFILEILSRLVNKQIWKYPKLWVGFLKCVLLTKPRSFGVLLQLPPAQLENALHRTAALKLPLIAHASQPNIHSSLPRSVLAVLGIASDPQYSSQAQTTPAHPEEMGNSDKEMVTEISKDPSSAS